MNPLVCQSDALLSCCDGVSAAETVAHSQLTGALVIFEVCISLVVMLNGVYSRLLDKGTLASIIA